jgi:carboxyl-terminal processing protease
MIVGLGPLFDAEEIGAFVDAGGSRLVWRYVDGQCIVGPGACLALDPPVISLQHRPTPIAVLLGPFTTSSREIAALAFRGQALTRSFGQPTQGLPTANEGFDLSDGAQILLTVAISTDRTGQRYDSALIPDVVVEGARETLCAIASEWLHTMRNPKR